MTDASLPDNAATVVVALGGNLPSAFGGVIATLEAALTALPSHGLQERRRSRWWRSAAWPDPADPPFINAVALCRTRLAPEAVLEGLHAIERSLGRDRFARNAPRTVDLDLIAYADVVLDEPGLVLPHPRARERLFVVGPLAEIAPGWPWPDGATAAELARAASVGADARPM